MKKLFIVANWKSNKTTQQAKEWLAGISNFKFQISNEKEVIVCPSFMSLSSVSGEIKNSKLEFRLGAQDISPFEEGAYTGEVNAKQIKEFADYVIIGHSERIARFNEDDAVLVRKIAMAKKYGLTPIFCVQDENTPIPSGITIVAYEPPSAIGTGVPDTPENADNIARKIKSELNDASVLYGGSVTANNVKSFTSMPNVDGVLVGGASLDAMEFGEIVKNS